MERLAYDVTLVDQLLSGALEVTRQEGYSVSMEHGVGGSAEVSVRVETNDRQSPFTAFRVVTEFEGMPAAFATSAILGRSRTTDFNEFVLRETLVAELERAPPEDPQNIGAVSVYEDHASYFGYVLESYMLRATRRLPDGSAFAIRVPVEWEGEAWTPRRYREKIRALSAWHVAGTPRGCRFTYIGLEKASLIFSFLPLYAVRQILCRMVAKYILRVRRVVLKEFASDGCAEIRPQRSFLFASGSAGVPLHWSSRGLSRSLGLSPADEAGAEPSSRSPFVLHSCAPPRRAPGAATLPVREAREAPKATELFFDLVGIDLERRASEAPWSLDGGASWVAPTPLSPDSRPRLDDGSDLSRAGQVLRAGARRLQMSTNPAALNMSAEAYRDPVPRPPASAGRPPSPAFTLLVLTSTRLARVRTAQSAEACRASLELSMRLETMSLAESVGGHGGARGEEGGEGEARGETYPPEVGAVGDIEFGPQPLGDDASGFNTYLNEFLPGAAKFFPGVPLSFVSTVLRESWRALKEESKKGYRMRAADAKERTTPTPPVPPHAIVDAPPPAYVEDPNSSRKSRARRCSDALAEDEARTPRRVCTPRESAPGPSSRPRAPAGVSTFLNMRLADAIKSQPGVPLGLIIDRLRAEWDSSSEASRARFEPVSAAAAAALGLSPPPLGRASPMRVVDQSPAAPAPHGAQHPAGPAPAPNPELVPRGPDRSTRRPSIQPILPVPIPGAPAPAIPPLVFSLDLPTPPSGTSSSASNLATFGEIAYK
eukprot:tig00021312_g20097.t1